MLLSRDQEGSHQGKGDWKFCMERRFVSCIELIHIRKRRLSGNR